MKTKTVLLKLLIITGLLSISISNNRYTIDINYSPSTLVFSARQEIRFKNTTGTDLKNIVLHIYGNKKLTRMDIAYNNYANFKNGYTKPDFKIKKLKINNKPVSYNIEGQDDTILNIQLTKPLSNEEKTIIQIEYTGTLPYMESRYGKFDHISHFSYFYPILSVYEKEKGWSKNPYSLKGQAFYSDVADYDVKITVPKNEVIAAPVKQILVSNNNTHKTERFIAKNIRSFHFSSSSLFKKTSKTAKNGVIINTYYLPSMKNSSGYILDYAESALIFYEEKYGKYPYKSFTIVPGNLVHAGEEFPGIILITKRFYKDAPNILFGGLLYRNRLLELIIAHETGHQWWNVVVGNDQYSQPWLDEGLTEYSTMLYMQDKYGKDSNLVELPHIWDTIKSAYNGTNLGNLRENTYRNNIYNHANVLSQNIDQYYDITDYFNNVYAKGSMIVKMFHKMVGNDLYFKTMQSYLDTYYMKNATIDDFIAVAENVCKRELKSFFNQWLTTSEVCDYSLGRWESKKEKYGYKNNIEIIRKEQITAPIDIEITYQNNQKEIIKITNNKKLNILNLKSSSQIKTIEIDPENKILEKDELNNASFIKNLNINPFSLNSPPNSKHFLSFFPPQFLNLFLNPMSLMSGDEFPEGLSFGKRDQYISLSNFPALTGLSYYQKFMDTKGGIFSYKLEKNHNEYLLNLNHSKYVPIYVIDRGLEYTELALRENISIINNFNSSYYDLSVYYDFFPGLLPFSCNLININNELNYDIRSSFYFTNNPVSKLGITYRSEGVASSNISGTGIRYEYNGYDDALYVTFIPITQRHNNNTNHIYEITIQKALFLNQYFSIKGEYTNSNTNRSLLTLIHEISLPYSLSILNDDIAIDNIKYKLSQEYYVDAEYLLNRSYITFDIGFFNSPILPFHFVYDHDLKDFSYGLFLMF